LAAGLVVALLLVCGAIAAGLRINGTHSFPVGTQNPNSPA
jgi:hypothetical protein